jgi:hypothetical protein
MEGMILVTDAGRERLTRCRFLDRPDAIQTNVLRCDVD